MKLRFIQLLSIIMFFSSIHQLQSMESSREVSTLQELVAQNINQRLALSTLSSEEIDGLSKLVRFSMPYVEYLKYNVLHDAIRRCNLPTIRKFLPADTSYDYYALIYASLGLAVASSSEQRNSMRYLLLRATKSGMLSDNNLKGLTAFARNRLRDAYERQIDYGNLAGAREIHDFGNFRDGCEPQNAVIYNLEIEIVDIIEKNDPEEIKREKIRSLLDNTEPFDLRYYKSHVLEMLDPEDPGYDLVQEFIHSCRYSYTSG